MTAEPFRRFEPFVHSFLSWTVGLVSGGHSLMGKSLLYVAACNVSCQAFILNQLRSVLSRCSGCVRISCGGLSWYERDPLQALGYKTSEASPLNTRNVAPFTTRALRCRALRGQAPRARVWFQILQGVQGSLSLISSSWYKVAVLN